MLEFVLFAIAAGCITLLIRPFRHRFKLPEWLVRARIRRRPGIPVTSWLAALLLMEVVWLFGERRGLLGLLALAVWIGAPMLAIWVSWYWIKGRRPTTEQDSGPGLTEDSVLGTQDSVETSGEPEPHVTNPEH